MSAHNLKCFMWFILFLVDTVVMQVGIHLDWFNYETFSSILMLVTSFAAIWQIFKVKDVDVSIDK